MSLARKMFSNVSYLLLARAAFRVLTAVVLIYAANYLGAQRFGQMETALAWANAFLAFNDLGMSQLIVREAARDEKKMAVYFGNTLVVEVVLSLLLYGVIIGIGYVAGYSSTTITLMAILGAATLLYEFRKVSRGIFRVLWKLKFVAAMEVVNGLLYLLTALWIFAAVTDKDLGLLGLAHARLWVNVIVIVALTAYALKLVRPTIDLKQLWPMVKQSYVFTLYNAFFMLYFQIDQIIISLMKNETEVGIYGSSAKIINLLLFIPIMVFQVIMPTMYKLSTSNMEKYQRMNHTIWRYLVAIGIPAGAGMTFLAAQIIPFVYNGDEYLAAIPIMQVMGLFLAMRFFGLSQGNSLTTTDRQGLRAGIQIASVAVNVILDIYLVYYYGAFGAAVATLITETIIALSYVSFSAHYLQESLLANIRTIGPVIISTVLMILALTFLSQYGVHVIVLVLIGAVVYLASLVLTRFFSAYDKQLISDIVGKKL